MIKKLFSNHHIVIWSIFILALILRGYGLSEQPPLDDEAAAASAASNYMNTGIFGQVMWYHPQLRNIIVFLSGKLFGGYTAWGLRFGSILCGSLTVLLLGYLTFSLFKKNLISCLAAFFLCIDPIHISASREAFQEPITMFFVVAGALSAYHAIKGDNIVLLYISGIFFGAAVSSKWHGLFPLAVSAVAYISAPWMIKSYAGERNICRRCLNAAGACAAVPVIIYVAIYIPWLYRGYSIPEFFNFQLWLIKHQYYYSGTLYDETMMPHRAYEWFLWPVAWVDFVSHQGKPYLNIAMGNFLIWGLTLPSLYFSVKSWIKDKSFNLGYILALFMAAYLPLLLTTRSVWVYLPPVVQFAFIFIAYTISSMIESGRVTKKALAIYVSLVILLSAVMYPMSTFRALEYSYIKPLAEMYSPHKGGN